MTKDGGPQAEIDDRLASEPPPESRVILYRLAQEALTNVRKHAGATSVTISMRSERGGTRIAIRDDGIGFDADPWRRDPGHVGVRSMVGRAESAGGWCRVDSEPGRGTTVEFWAPSIVPPTPLVHVGRRPSTPGGPRPGRRHRPDRPVAARAGTSHRPAAGNHGIRCLTPAAAHPAGCHRPRRDRWLRRR